MLWFPVIKTMAQGCLFSMEHVQEEEAVPISSLIFCQFDGCLQGCSETLFVLRGACIGTVLADSSFGFFCGVS